MRELSRIELKKVNGGTCEPEGFWQNVGYYGMAIYMATYGSWIS